MKILELATGIEHNVSVTPVSAEDLKQLTRKRYFFNWTEAAKKATLYKLQIEGDDDIKGVMGLIDYPTEQRIEIKLLTASKENVILKHEKRSKNKAYDGIAGNLIAFAAREAVGRYGAMACVSLIPKTGLKAHYINEYGMMDAGSQVFLELNPLRQIIEKYIL